MCDQIGATGFEGPKNCVDFAAKSWWTRTANATRCTTCDDHSSASVLHSRRAGSDPRSPIPVSVLCQIFCTGFLRVFGSPSDLPFSRSCLGRLCVAYSPDGNALSLCRTKVIRDATPSSNWIDRIASLVWHSKDNDVGASRLALVLIVTRMALPCCCLPGGYPVYLIALAKEPYETIRRLLTTARFGPGQSLQSGSRRIVFTYRVSGASFGESGTYDIAVRILERSTGATSE